MCKLAFMKKQIWPRGDAILVVENAIFIIWQLKWRHQFAKFNFFFIQATLPFSITCKKFFEYPRRGALQKF